MENYLEISPPGGENLNQMCERVNDFMAGILASRFSRVALITHAGVIRIILSKHLNKPIGEMFNEKIEFGELRVLNVH
jgi:alpha-ribazole phosphatase